MEVNHDHDLYNLKVKTSHGVQVIHTTSNHLFYDPYLDHGWIPANHLKPGMHLKTPGGQAAVVVGGSTPAIHDGWMWDLTVPGNNDHDFYVIPATGTAVQAGGTEYRGATEVPVLVHNDSCPEVFYCAMSKKEYSRLGPNGEISVRGTENFVTQSREYLQGLADKFARMGGRNAEKYSVLVRYEMEPGTLDSLVAAGKTPDEIGQDLNAVHLKTERGFDTFGLRPGSVDIFNSRITGFGRVNDWTPGG